MVKKEALKNASDRIAEESKAVASAAATRMRDEMMGDGTIAKPVKKDTKNESVDLKSREQRTESKEAPVPVATNQNSVGNKIGRGIDWLIAKTRAALIYIFITLPTRFWNWAQRINIIGLGNIALLLAIIIMFSIIIARVWTTGERAVTSVMGERTPRAERIVTERPTAAPARVRVPANVTIDTARDTMTVEMPLQAIAQPMVTEITDRDMRTPVRRMAAQTAAGNQNLRSVSKGQQPGRLVARVWTHGDMIVDGARPGDGNLRPGASIRGNLFIQNHRRITLPCGVFIDGDLHLRNVGLLSFCNDFTITGNIYVSKNSSFGPIPRTARLGGQVIF